MLEIVKSTIIVIMAIIFAIKIDDIGETLKEIKERLPK